MVEPVIAGRSNRRKPIIHDRDVYTERSRIERMFGHLKIYRTVATRHDQPAGRVRGMIRGAAAAPCANSSTSGTDIASFSIGVPDFFNSAHHALALGLWRALAVAAIAGLLLCLGGILTSLIAIRSRLSTYLLTQRSFGTGGAAAINLVVAFIHFCWFGVKRHLIA